VTRSAEHSSVPLAEALQSVGLQVEVGPLLVRIRSDMSGVHQHLEDMYADFPKRAGDEAHVDIAVVGSRGARRWLRPQARLFVNGARPFLPVPATLAGPLFEWGLNWSIGRSAHRWVVVHAAVLERGGRALILPAPPGSGKSTLCAALAFSGWRLFSDEFAVLNPKTGRISPIPRPISLKAASIPIIRRRHSEAVLTAERRDVEGVSFVHVRPPADSVRRAREDAMPGWVVLPRYVAGRKTTLDRLPKAQALMRIVDESFNYNYLGTSGFDCLTELVRQAGCYTFEYSDLDDALAVLADMTTN
jgi:HprK-related kinase A